MGLKDFFKHRKTEDDKSVDSIENFETETAYAVPNSNRALWSGGLVRGLTPERLASILDAVRNGEPPAEYLEIAQELEQRDLHYRSVLSTRKHAVEGLEMFVQAASDGAEDKKIAVAVEADILNHADIMDLRKNALDALGKGFSVNEIVWDTSGKRWKPESFLFRDPRWFAYDKDTGDLCLREPLGNGLVQLEPYKFIVHEPNLLSGMQITSGLSFTALFYWLIKTYDVTSWAAFADRFGYPVRIGKYGKKATKEDIATLRRAVASIGSDVGAVIPDSMLIDIVESKTTGTNSTVYREMAEWVNKEISKLVLGQTASAEGTAGALGNQQGQEEVRQDICRADARQFDQSINRDLVIPYVRLNFGDRDAYPKIRTKLVEAKNVQLIVDSIIKLVPFGLEVAKSEMRALLGLSDVADDDDILKELTYSGGTYQEDTLSEFFRGLLRENKNNHANKISLNNSVIAPVAPPEMTEAEPPEADADVFVRITDEIADVLEKAADATTDFTSFQKELEKLVVNWSPDKIAELVAVSTFKARVQGQQDFYK
jgi:phage gp29-like protein